MIEYKFRVALEDVPGMPGCKRGACVIPAPSEILNGYDYECWRVISPLSSYARTRVEHHGKFEDRTVYGETLREVDEAVRAMGREVAGG